MTDSPVTHDCVYATSGWGIHDERWVSGLLEVGLTPHVVSLGRDVPDALELRQAVLEAAAGGLPVLAGPLHTVTRPLADLPIRLVTAAIDEKLNDRAFIVPGLGDAGDRQFGGMPRFAE